MNDHLRANWSKERFGEDAPIAPCPASVADSLERIAGLPPIYIDAHKYKKWSDI